MELREMNAEAVMQAMDVQQPKWWLSWADQRDLQDAAQAGYVENRQAAFLRSRCGDKVMLVLRSAYQLTKEAA